MLQTNFRLKTFGNLLYIQILTLQLNLFTYFSFSDMEYGLSTGERQTGHLIRRKFGIHPRISGNENVAMLQIEKKRRYRYCKREREKKKKLVKEIRVSNV